MTAEAPDRLDLIRIELRKAQRQVRYALQMVAQEIDSKAAENDSPGGTHDRDRDTSTEARQ